MKIAPFDSLVWGLLRLAPTYTARVDYISSPISSIAFLNFESTRLVSLCVAAAF